MEEIVELINYTYDKYHSKKIKLTVSKRLKGIANSYNQLIKIAKKNYNLDANKYYNTRLKSDKKLLQVQTKALQEINRCLKNILCEYHIMPASSFSAQTHLIGDSDIDFMVRIKNISINDIVKITNYLGNYGYIFKKIGTPDDDTLRYFIHSKIIDNIEIEVKIRDYDGANFIAKLHNYLDNKLTKEQQIYTTYIKYLMKNNNYNDEYWKFKLIYNEYGLYKIKSSSLIMPLV
jgi:hypothetical protein